MTRFRILILGSAPNAVVPCADLVYCANSSVNYHAEKITSIPKIVGVVSSHLIAGIKSSNASETVKQVRDDVFSSKIHEMLVLEHKPWFDGWNLEQGMQDVEQAIGIRPELVTFSQRISILRAITGLKEPIWSHTFLTDASRENPMHLARLSKLFLKDFRKKRRGNLIEANPVFRPSTGMWAAMAAMVKYGTEAKYLFSGISLDRLSNRSIHHNGKSQGEFEHFTHHLHADIRIFNTLKKAYDVEYI